ncbi:uncharacterized protein RAG0_11650 [Rhynchosporium agropyri]|uniref:Uncharacterized protein n=1 Tax=Rhynchosporium agropyri TaxID=914238 RepID=A0A1E1L522_9HELO|nr:uncharacterized protein RAG0_11650 [Rhynchosporium agropyri]
MESSTAIMTPMMAEESDDPNAVSEIDENSQIRNLSKDTEASTIPMAPPQTVLSLPLCPQASFRDPPSHMEVPSARRYPQKIISTLDQLEPQHSSSIWRIHIYIGCHGTANRNVSRGMIG